MTRLACGMPASAALPGATTIMRWLIWQATAALNMAGQFRSSELSANSATNSYSSIVSGGSWPLAAKSPTAMAKSNRPPSLGRSAGAKFMVIRLAGNSKPALMMALRTLSLLSLTAVSGRPTMVSAGKPALKCVSTLTKGASTPT